MDKILYDVLNNIDEGIVILNEKLEICVWNNYMEHLTDIKEEEVINSNLYDVLPNLRRNYFSKIINNVMNNGCKMFFSAAMHGKLINNKQNLNLKISRIEKEKCVLLFFEFIDVTNQFIQVSRLKKYVNKLHKLNEELRKKENIIRKLAYRDGLTGVANRSLFYKFSEKFISTARRNNTLIGIMFIDIDRFKAINDTYGHEIGDEVLVKVANILTESTRKTDVVARYGGDEFLILLPYIKDINDCKVVASRIFSSKNNILDYCGRKISLSLSIGVSIYPYHGDTIDKLIAEADSAMYIAKKRDGQDNYVVIS